jgi:hypothetical protein
LLQGADAAQIWFPAALGMIVGVADVIAHRGAFAAKVTGIGHDSILSKNIYDDRIIPEKQGAGQEI